MPDCESTSLDEFMLAVIDGRPDDVRSSLQADPALANAYNPKGFGSTPLNHAAGRRDLPLIDLLLDHGADPNLMSDWWAGPFGVLHSIPHDSVELVEGLGDVTQGGAISKRLIERGAIVDVHAASHLGMLDRLRELLDADPSLIDAKGGDGQRSLHYSASEPIAAFLLERGADLEAKDVDHESTAAQWLATARPEVAKFLVQRGAVPDPFMAVAIDDVELLERLIADEPEGVTLRLTDERFPTQGSHEGNNVRHIYIYTIGLDQTLLHAAANRGTPSIAKWLLDQGADPMARGGYDDATPLHSAAWSGNAPVMATLLDADVDIDVCSGKIHDNTPLGWAIVAGKPDVVELLLKRGAKVFPHHPVDAKAGADGEFRKWSGSSLEAWQRIDEMITNAKS